MANLNELKASREDHFLAADKLIKAAQASGKDLAGAALAEYQGHIAEMKTITAQIKRTEEMVGHLTVNPGSMFGPGQPSASEWRDQSGRPVAVLSKDQSFSLSLGDKITERPSYNFGEFVKALVKGTRNPEIQAALSESGGGATGDYTVPVVLLPQLIDLMRAKTVCVQAGAQTIGLDTEITNLARIAADPTPVWRSEAAAFTEAAPTFERVQFVPKSLGVLVKVSMELIEDSANVNEALLTH